LTCFDWNSGRTFFFHPHDCLNHRCGWSTAICNGNNNHVVFHMVFELKPRTSLPHFRLHFGHHVATTMKWRETPYQECNGIFKLRNDRLGQKDLKRFPNRPWATLPKCKVHGMGLNNASCIPIAKRSFTSFYGPSFPSCATSWMQVSQKVPGHGPLAACPDGTVGWAIGEWSQAEAERTALTSLGARAWMIFPTIGGLHYF
jgi:hypothetical protein